MYHRTAKGSRQRSNAATFDYFTKGLKFISNLIYLLASLPCCITSSSTFFCSGGCCSAGGGGGGTIDGGPSNSGWPKGNGDD